MDTKFNRTPRQLARDYYDGLLNFDEYRHKRRRLIDDIVRPDVTQPLPGTADTVRHTTPQSRSPDPETPAEKPQRKWLLPGVAVVLMGVITGWVLFSGDRDAENMIDEPASPLDTSMVTSAEAVVAGSAIDAFLAVDDWGYDALVELTLAWSVMQPQEQAAIRGTPAFMVMSDRLRDRILEQRALVDINGEAAGREDILLSLAGHLGIAVTETVAVQTDAPPMVEEPLELVMQEPEIQEPAEPPPAEETQPDRLANEAGVLDAASSETDVAQQQHAAEPAAVTTPPVSDDVEAAPARDVAEEVVVAPATSVSEPPIENSPAVEEPVKTQANEATPPAKDPCSASLARTRRPYCKDVFTDGSKGPVMVVLPIGSFRMGSDHKASEQPIHAVNITRPFAISAYEVSVADYQRFCKASGRHCVAAWTGDKDPIVNVSWKDARSYANWLSKETGMTYRLPTEAEWEYAARGHTTTDYPFSEGDKVLPSDARFNASGPLAVDDKSVNVNKFRLRHIVGNVREWVEDAWFGNYQSVREGGRARTSSATSLRVVRGGSFADAADQLRSAARTGLSSDTRDRKTGFRVARDIRN